MTAARALATTAVLVLTGLGVTTGPAQAAAAPSCQGRVPTLVASSDAERLQGTDDDDVISIEGFERVEVDGRGGDDVICSSAWSQSVVRGGPGDDVLQDVKAEREHRYDEPTRLLGGPGADRLVGAGSTRTAASYEDEPAGVSIRLDAGTVVAGGSTDHLAGIRLVYGSDFADTFVGSPGDDHYRSAYEWDPDTDADTVRTGEGDDAVTVFGGTVDLGPGDDDGWGLGARLRGGPGQDTLDIELSGAADGGAGRDMVTGGADMDLGGPEPSRIVLNGGGGADRLTIPAAYEEGPVDCPEYCTRSSLSGGSGTDTLFLGGPRARVDLGRGRARVPGGRASVGRIENVVGSQYADVIRGDAKANRIGGGRGNDVLLGGPGNDRLSGGPGRDRADGGAGRDRCTAEIRRSC